MPDEHPKPNLLQLIRRIPVSRDLLLKASIFLGLIALIAFLFPRGETLDLEYKVGQVWARKDLIAPFSFPIYRDERDYIADVNAAKAKVYPVFERRPGLVDEYLARLDYLFERIGEGAADWTRFRRSVKENRETRGDDSVAFFSLSRSLPVRIHNTEWDFLADAARSGRLGEMHKALTMIADEYLRRGIIDRGKSTITRQSVAVRRGTLEEIIPLDRLLDEADVAHGLEARLEPFAHGDTVAASLAFRLGSASIKPTILYSEAATAQTMAAAVESVPRTLGFVQEYERIISKHERITPETRLKLESLKRVKAERDPQTNSGVQYFGILLHVAIVLLLYGIYLYLFRKRIFRDNNRLLLIALIVLLQGFFAYVSRILNVNSPVEYLIFLPASSMLLTIIFDSRVAFYGTVIMSFLVAGIRGNDYSVALACLVAGALSVYTVRDMRNRNQVFRSTIFIFLGYGMTVVALGLERFELMEVVLEQLLFAFINGVVSPILAYGLLIFFERFFKVTTDLTLIELAHFNHPLLRMLAEQAPGTYHHSVNMATLAESAAVAVGANEVLARVGAYFHDVGKIEKPPYFVENQKGNRNKHEKLSPRMSSLIIQAHVKDGIALAKEYNLPQEVVDFIPMHHGTTRIDYFYNKALRLAQSSDDETKIDEIKEQDYRYPGPKPQTKETGILMLADGIEATARSMDDQSPPRLEQMIDDHIKKRFGEGELDECPLTLKDLTRIKTAFLNVLIGVYHTRVKYPGPVEKKKPFRRPERNETKPPVRYTTEPPPTPEPGPEQAHSAEESADQGKPANGQ